jgi:putative phosphoesterase
MDERTRRIGVISDTHGLLREEAVAALEGVDAIIHAGDVGGPDILERLRAIAPVFAVRGNTDYGQFGASLPSSEVVTLRAEASGAGSTLAYVVHDIAELEVEPSAAGFAVVVYGHSHRPAVETRGGVLYFNPGAAGPRRFDLPVTVGMLRVSSAGRVEGLIVDLHGEEVDDGF